MNSSYFTINSTTWLCISVYYGRESWPLFLNFLVNYYKKNTNIFNGFSFSFSDDRGEHIRIIFTTEKNSPEKLKETIEKDFYDFLKIHPSQTKKEFPYGKRLWIYYPNNSIVWNRFEIKTQVVFNDRLGDFFKYSSLLVESYIEEEITTDDAISIAILLAVLLLKSMNRHTGLENSFLEILRIEKSQNRSSCFELTDNIILEHDLYEIINSYWHDKINEDEMDETLKLWLSEVTKIYDNKNENEKFTLLMLNIYSLLGLSTPMKFFVTQLFIKWIKENECTYPNN